MAETGYTLAFHENEGIQIFDTMYVHGLIVFVTSDGLYKLKHGVAVKTSLAEVVG